MLPVFYHKFPIFRLLMAFAIGINWQGNFDVSFLIFWGLICVGILLQLIFTFLPIHLKFVWRWIPGIGITAIFIALGIFIMQAKDIRKQTDWFGNFENYDSAKVLLTEPIVEKSKTYAVRGEVMELRAANQPLQSTTGKIILYITKDYNSAKLKYGDLIQIPINSNSVSMMCLHG